MTRKARLSLPDTVLAFVAVLFLTATAAFADVATGVQQLDSACAARIGAIGSPPGSKKEATEAKNLQKVRDKLATYDGKNTVDTFRKVAGALKFVYLAATDDAAVLAGATTIVEGFAEGADKRIDSAASQLAQLIDPKHEAVVDAAIDSFESFVQKGRNSILTNPLKASALLITAYDQLGLLIVKAKRLVEAEAGSPPPAGLAVTVGASSGSLDNAGPAYYDISKIRVFAVVTSNGGTVKTYAGDNAKTVIPGFLAAAGSNRIAAGSSFDLGQVFSGLVPPGTANPRVAGVLQVTLKGEPFFNVFFDVVPN